MSEHEPTFTNAKYRAVHGGTERGVGLYCSCGWVFGIGNQLACNNAFDRHMSHVGQMLADDVEKWLNTEERA